MKGNIFTTILGFSLLIFSLNSQAIRYNGVVFLESESEQTEFCLSNYCTDVIEMDYDYDYYNKEDQLIPVYCIITPTGCDFFTSMIQSTIKGRSKSSTIGKLYVVNYSPTSSLEIDGWIRIHNANNIYDIIDICYAGSVKCTKVAKEKLGGYTVTANYFSTPDPTPPPLKPGEKPGEDDPE
jgi:hypothetical protein